MLKFKIFLTFLLKYLDCIIKINTFVSSNNEIVKQNNYKMLQHLINIIKKVVKNTEVTTVANPAITKKTTTSKGNTTRKTVIIDKSKRTNALLEKLDLFTKGTPPQNWSPSRFLYKVGVLHLKDITPELIIIAKNETKLLKKDAFRYSLIWALGRCGDERVLPLLDTLVKTDEKEYIKRLTLEVYLKLAATSAKEELLKNIKDLIPVDALHTLENSEVTSLYQDNINLSLIHI